MRALPFHYHSCSARLPAFGFPPHPHALRLGGRHLRADTPTHGSRFAIPFSPAVAVNTSYNTPLDIYCIVHEPFALYRRGTLAAHAPTYMLRAYAITAPPGFCLPACLWSPGFLLDAGSRRFQHHHLPHYHCREPNARCLYRNVHTFVRAVLLHTPRLPLHC